MNVAGGYLCRLRCYVLRLRVCVVVDFRVGSIVLTVWVLLIVLLPCVLCLLCVFVVLW